MKLIANTSKKLTLPKLKVKSMAYTLKTPPTQAECHSNENENENETKASMKASSFEKKEVNRFQFILDQLKWFFHTVFLFTKTDIHNLVLPACTLNLVLHLYFRSQCAMYDWSVTVFSILKTFVWGYLGLIHIDVGNQLMGIEEDRLNKPFRPLVTGLITKEGALQLVTFSTIVFVLVGNTMQVLWSTLGFMAATSVYNFTQTSSHWIGKNLCNAWGYGCFFSAGAWIAYWDLLEMQGPNQTMLDFIYQLLPFHMTNIFLTITIQDLRDIKGDLKVHRLTQNLDWGERVTRYYLCGSMALMTFLSSWLWPSLPSFSSSSSSSSSSSLSSLSLMFSLSYWTRRHLYYMVLWGLQTWMGYRIVRDCPNYDIVTLPNGERIPVHHFERTIELSDSAKESPKVLEKESIEQRKQEQYEKDDWSFKIYILWLYLFTFNVLF